MSDDQTRRHEPWRESGGAGTPRRDMPQEAGPPPYRDETQRMQPGPYGGDPTQRVGPPPRDDTQQVGPPPDYRDPYSHGGAPPGRESGAVTERVPTGDERVVRFGGSRWIDIDRVKLKTSAAAVFGLIFSFSAIVAWFLGPVALLFALLGILLSVAGGRSAKNRPHVTGRGVAGTGLVLGIIGFLLAAASTVGYVFAFNDADMRSQIRDNLEQLNIDSPVNLE